MAERGLLVAAGAALALVTIFLSAGAVPAQAAYPHENGKIAFVSDRDGNEEVYSMNPDGSRQTNLTKNAAADNRPAWSPDGARIAFISDRDGNREIYVANADGSRQTNLSKHPAPDFGHVWSPDGARIAFTSDRDGNQEIYVANADGSGLTNLTENAAADNSPAWSPDGARIAFKRGADVFVMNADGSGQKNITNTPADMRVSVAWSPDGANLAYVEGSYETEYGCASVNVYTTSVEGTGPARQISQPLQDCGQGAWYFRPQWSPDGTKIMYEVEEYHDPRGVLVADLQNAKPASYIQNAGHAAWSPDGAKIVFTSVMDYGEEYPSDEVQTVNADGSERTNLTNNWVGGGGPSPQDYDPQWAPACASCPGMTLPGEEDRTDPTVRPLRPVPGSKIRDRTPVIKVVVRDRASELASADIRLYV